jgi:hypothetical protein
MSSLNVSSGDNFTGWKSALAEARRQYSEAAARMRCLKKSIELIENKIKSDEPWPITQRPQEASTPN